MVVAVRKELRAITEAKVKTDRLDARMLARLLAAGLLNGCWLPDERTRSLRRRLARRAQLVRHRTRCKNEVHAVLMRNLQGRPPMTDAFGKRGRGWLSRVELPRDERQTVDGCLRQIDFLNDGRISKQGASQTRAMLAEAAFVSVRTGRSGSIRLGIATAASSRRSFANVSGHFEGFSDLSGHLHKSLYAESPVMPRNRRDRRGTDAEARKTSA